MAALLLVVLVVLLAPVAPAESALPRLTVERGDDAAIVDDAGRQVLLRGINVNQLGDYYARNPARPASRHRPCARCPAAGSPARARGVATS